jgi:hypothetical protein
MKKKACPNTPIHLAAPFNWSWLVGLCLVVGFSLATTRVDSAGIPPEPKWLPYAEAAASLYMAAMQQEAGDPLQALQTLYIAQKYSRVATSTGGNDLVRQNDRLIAQAILHVQQLLKNDTTDKKPSEHARGYRPSTLPHQSSPSYFKTNFGQPAPQPGHPVAHN